MLGLQPLLSSQCWFIPDLIVHITGWESPEVDCALGGDPVVIRDPACKPWSGH